MSRPKCCRKINSAPDRNCFEPRGIPSSELEEVFLSLDEFEAIRLADFNGMYQEEAAGQMAVSRQTFGRIIESAHKKIADVLINGKSLKIEGGMVEIEKIKFERCPKCRKNFDPSDETSFQKQCPRCNKNQISI